MWVLLLFIFVFSGAAPAASFHQGRVVIPSGKFTPLFGLDKLQDSFHVGSFEIDSVPVTYRDFEKFLKINSEWTKKKVYPLYIDEKYLANWASPQKYRALAEAPITYVTWYAATAYCEAKKGRLPTTLEWEYVAAASETEKDASKSPQFNQRIIDWYSKPSGSPSKKKIGQEKPNFYGLYNLHGLIWEWTSDFNTFFVASDNRSDGDKSKDMFCGAGAIGAKDRDNYAAFMRYASRSSMQARFSTENLGFRCAYDSEGKNEKQN